MNDIKFPPKQTKYDAQLAQLAISAEQLPREFMLKAVTKQKMQEDLDKTK